MKRNKTTVAGLLFFGILGLIIMRGFFTSRQERSVRIDQLDIEIMQNTVDTFAERLAQIKKQCGTYPKSLDELLGEGLCTPVCPKVNCLKPGAKVDIWGNQIQLIHEGGGLIVRSMGEDGRIGGHGHAQDIEAKLPAE